VTLPLPLRNRLADLILAALHDGGARRGLEALAAVCGNPHALDAGPPPAGFPAELFDRRPDGWLLKSGFRQHVGALGERATRAATAPTRSSRRADTTSVRSTLWARGTAAWAPSVGRPWASQSALPAT